MNCIRTDGRKFFYVDGADTQKKMALNETYLSREKDGSPDGFVVL